MAQSVANRCQAGTGSSRVAPNTAVAVLLTWLWSALPRFERFATTTRVARYVYDTGEGTNPARGELFATHYDIEEADGRELLRAVARWILEARVGIEPA